MNPYSLPLLKAMGVNTPVTTTPSSVILYNPAEMVQYNSLFTLLAQQQFLLQQQQQLQVLHQRQQDLQGALLNGMASNMQGLPFQTARTPNLALPPELQAMAANQMMGHYEPAYQFQASMNPASVSALSAVTSKAATTPHSLANVPNMVLEQQLMAIRADTSMMSFYPLDHISNIPVSVAPVSVRSMPSLQILQIPTSNCSDSNDALAKQSTLEQKTKNEAAMLKTQSSSSPVNNDPKYIVTPRTITIPRSEKVMKLMKYPAILEHLQTPKEEPRPNELKGLPRAPLLEVSSETSVNSPSTETPSTTTSTDSDTPSVFKIDMSLQNAGASTLNFVTDLNNNEMNLFDQAKRTQGKLKRKRNDISSPSKSCDSPSSVKIGKDASGPVCDSQPTTSQMIGFTSTDVDDPKKEEDFEVYINVESEPANGRLRRDQKRTIYSKVKHLLKRGNSLTCNLCKKDVLTNHNSVTDHLAEHSGEKQVACVFCGWTTFEKSLMGDHMKTFHPEKKEQKYEDIRDLSKMIEFFSECFPQPGRARHEYSEKLEMFTQALMEKNIARIECGICDAKIQVNKKLIEKHVMTHPHFRCKLCAHQTNDEAHQQEHQNQQHKQTCDLGRDYTQCTSSEAMTKVFRKCFQDVFKLIEKSHSSSILFESSSPTISDTV